MNPSGVRQSEVFALVYLVLDRDKLSVLAGQAQLVSPSVSAGAIHHSGGGLVPEAPVTVEIQTVSMSFKVVIYEYSLTILCTEAKESCSFLSLRSWEDEGSILGEEGRVSPTECVKVDITVLSSSWRQMYLYLDVFFNCPKQK